MKTNTIKEIREKIEEIRLQLLSIEINPTNFDYYDKLLDIERKLWDFMYFIKNQEENWLMK